MHADNYTKLLSVYLNELPSTQSDGSTRAEPSAPPAEEEDPGSSNLPILDSLAVELDHQKYCELFCDNIVRIYEFDKTEITESMTSYGGEKNTKDCRESLKALRLFVFENVTRMFPNHAGMEMYNRRKCNLLAEDIYVIEYC